MPLLSIDDIEEALPAVKRLPADTLTRIRDRAEAALAVYLRADTDVTVPSLVSASRTVYLDGPTDEDSRVLDLWSALGLPVTAVSSVEQDTDGDRAYSTTVSSADYELVDGRTLELLPNASDGWGSGRRYIRVTCTAGYDESSTPDDIVDALVLTVRAHWMERAGRTGQQVEQGADALGVRVRVPAAARELVAWRRNLAGVVG